MTAAASPAARPTTPSLDRRQRRGAAIAGIVGFPLVTVGWLPFVAVIIGYIFAYGVYFLGSMLGGDDTRYAAESDTGKLAAELIGIPSTSVGLVIIVSLAVGIVLIGLGVFLSNLILKRHGVSRAAGVTWLGLPSGGLTALYFVIAVAIQVLLGWLCWWWMAHAFRRPLAPRAQQSAPEILPAT